ncbi:hypothetical protein VUR80DRAFT_4882 [Thermomyces stellatus]
MDKLGVWTAFRVASFQPSRTVLGFLNRNQRAGPECDDTQGFHAIWAPNAISPILSQRPSRELKTIQTCGGLLPFSTVLVVPLCLFSVTDPWAPRDGMSRPDGGTASPAQGVDRRKSPAGVKALANRGVHGGGHADSLLAQLHAPVPLMYNPPISLATQSEMEGLEKSRRMSAHHIPSPLLFREQRWRCDRQGLGSRPVRFKGWMDVLPDSDGALSKLYGANDDNYRKSRSGRTPRST